MPKKTDAGGASPLLPDAEARRRIREDLATTLLVEASAGTGKTQSLVDRMTSLVATGTTPVDRLSAVTFTIRAAGQLRQRFQNGLEKAIREDRPESERRRLAQALAGIHGCFSGTIHAFAARLLRERPVEAGLDPRFREMDEPEDGVARGEAWDRFTERLFLEDDPRLGKLLALGLDLDDLREPFEKICENADVEAVRGSPTPEPDFSDARSAVEAFLDRAVATMPASAPEGGWNKFQEAIRRSERLRALHGSERGEDFVRILRVLRPSQSTAGALKKPFDALRDDVVKPALEAWAEYAHPVVMDILIDARRAYADWRRREGRLNFQDLLVCARDLLRDHPAVRRALRQRFTPILVDEFQDTDPIQAEILFYLTGSREDEKDWRRLEPVPGALFVVGDPKQSIYRFRRADIQIYQAVRDRIGQCGAVLSLSTNFRSASPLCDWINAVFAGLFAPAPDGRQPAYVPIVPRDPAPPSAASVFRLDTRVGGQANQPVIDHDATRIADFVAAEIEAGRRRPEDFLLLFRRRRFMADYARALEARGITCEQGGGDAFRESEELADFLTALSALADPENPVPLLAALRGPLFGIDDEALYRFVRAGGKFSFRSSLPLGADPRLAEAFGLFRSAESAVETMPPGAAISRFAEILGWTALAAARPLGDSRAGNLLKALAAARRLSGEGLDFPGVARELNRLRAERWIEQMSVEPGRPDAVRLLTLHGAKGLEAPVVFLAEPAYHQNPKPTLWIDRTSDPPLGYFRAIRRFGDHGVDEVARPPGWPRMEALEKEFENAEGIRLLYVGATRAKETLVVSVKTAKDGKVSGPWAGLAGAAKTELPQRAAAPAPASASPPPDEIAAELTAFLDRRGESLRLSSVPSQASASVTAIAHAEAGPAPAREDTGRGMEWGRILHRLLEALLRDPDLDVRAYAANLFAEEERPEGDLDDAVRLAQSVRSSPLWKRAVASPRRLMEVPFALMVPSRELGVDDGPPETLLTGAIDLLFEEDGGWFLVDYKSDRVGERLSGLAAWYAPQIRLYSRYWERVTGKPARAGLYFIETGEEVWLEPDGRPAATGSGEGSSRPAGRPRKR